MKGRETDRTETEHVPTGVEGLAKGIRNRPLLSYVLELVEASNIKDIIVLVSGDDAALCIGNWVTEAFRDCLCIEVCAKKNPSLTWSFFSGFIRASS